MALCTGSPETLMTNPCRATKLYIPYPTLRIPLVAIFGGPTLLFAAEAACGTEPRFACLMSLALLFAGLTYNILGGVGTLSGAAFSMLALRGFVISQIAKVLLRQPADSHMAAPILTACVYATFSLAVLVGSFVFSHIRLPLPRALEPETESQYDTSYFIALTLGAVGNLLLSTATVFYGSRQEEATQFNSSHSAGSALEAFLPVAVVLAVDQRIRQSGGRRSINWRVVVPAAIGIIFGLINTQRESVAAPVLIYLLACYFRGYRFRFKHYAAVAVLVAAFFVVISPLELYTRTIIGDQDISDRVNSATRVIGHADFRQIAAIENSVSDEDASEDYYGLPGTTVLSRVSRIRMDSNLIAACEHFHYKFRALKQDLLVQIPHILYKNKPEYDSGLFVGSVAGVTNEFSSVSEPAFTMIGDSFGAFGFLGSMIVGLFFFPLTLCVYESVFDARKPWGTVALVSCAMLISEGGVGRLVGAILLKTTIYLLVASYGTALIARMLPVSSGRELASESSI